MCFLKGKSAIHEFENTDFVWFEEWQSSIRFWHDFDELSWTQRVLKGSHLQTTCAHNSPNYSANVGITLWEKVQAQVQII